MGMGKKKTPGRPGRKSKAGFSSMATRDVGLGRGMKGGPHPKVSEKLGKKKRRV